MLAERKVKIKWSTDPQNTHWTNGIVSLRVYHVAKCVQVYVRTLWMDVTVLTFNRQCS